MNHADPRVIIAHSPMSAMQVRAVAVLIGLNALDGFDVLAISFASPGIATEWGIDRARLGIVLSMELIGMGIGSMLLGGVADSLGRRRAMLSCLVVMAIGMLMATTTSSIVTLSVWRVLTGLGIGGMLACGAASAAEISNDRRRPLCVSWVAIGYPIGAVVGGSIAAVLLRYFDWRSVFLLGSALTAASIPLVYFCVPESVVWLCQKRPPGALKQINRTLERMRHATLDRLPELRTDGPRESLRDIFAPGMALTTVLVTAAYFTHITTFYFLVKWIPKILVDMGFTASQAAGVLVWTNLGGALGGILFGLATQRFPLKPLILGAMGLSVVSVVGFGLAERELFDLTLITFAAGFWTSAATVGMYATFAQVFPTHIRAFGTGFGIGVGRGGSVISPILAGFLFTAGLDLRTVAAVMACGSIAAICALVTVRYQPRFVQPAGA